MNWYQQRKNKYKNERTIYDGISYASIKEANCARDLDLRKKGKDIKDWSSQIPFGLLVNEKKICRYIVDFQIIHKDNSVELVECKGYATRDWKIKKKLFEATVLKEHPKWIYTIV